MNPELQRNLWLGATPRRLAFAGAILFGVFVAVWLVDRGRHAGSVVDAGAAVFALSALGWGAQAARAAVIAEVRAGSWDAQRLSALSPFALTWGKLVGSTALPSALGAGGLLIGLLQLASVSSLAHAGFWLVVAIGLAATLQASALATGLLDIRRARASGAALGARAPGLLLLSLGLLSLVALVWVRARVGQALVGAGGAAAALSGAPAPAQAPAASVGWYGRHPSLLGFSAASLLALAGWALVWAWRLMRLELQHANAPWAWIGFLLTAGLYVLGFDPAPSQADPLAARLVAAAGVFAVLAYVAAFAGPADRLRARRFTAALQGRRPARLLTHLPLTVAPSLLALVASLAVALLRLRAGETGPAVEMLAAVAFFGRDLGLIAWRRFVVRRGRRGQGEASALLLILALYLLGSGLGWLVARSRGAALFWPTPEHPRLDLLAGTLEAVLAWGLAALAVSRPGPAPPQPHAPLEPTKLEPEPNPAPTSVPVTEEPAPPPNEEG